MPNLSDATLARLAGFSLTQRQLIINFVSPNQEPLADAGFQVFFDLLDRGTLQFAEVDTANEHLHVPHPAFEAKQWCTVCHAMQLQTA